MIVIRLRNDNWYSPNIKTGLLTYFFNWAVKNNFSD